MATTDVNPPTGRRERKKRQTRDTLVAIGLKMFSADGFTNTTVEAISEAADVSVSTFFRYFDTKEDIVFADADRDLDELRSLLLSRPPEEPDLVAVRATILAFARYLEDRREQILTRTRLMASTSSLQLRGLDLQRRYEETLVDALTTRRGLAKPDLRLRMIAAVGLSTLLVASQVWRGGRKDRDLPTLTQQTLTILGEVADEEGF